MLRLVLPILFVVAWFPGMPRTSPRHRWDDGWLREASMEGSRWTRSRAA